MVLITVRGYSAAACYKSMENFANPNRNKTRDFPACSAVPQSSNGADVTKDCDEYMLNKDVRTAFCLNASVHKSKLYLAFFYSSLTTLTSRKFRIALNTDL